MRVLHVTESRSWSGGTVQLWHLCRALQRKGHAVSLVCPPDSELFRHAPGSGVDVTLCAMRQDYDLAAAFRLARVLRRVRPHVTHAHHPRAHALTLLAGALAPAGRLVVSRRVSFPLKRWNLFSQWKYRTPRIDSYVAVSEDIRRALVAGGVPAPRVHVIHSGVDVDTFSPRPPNEALRREFSLPAAVPIVGNLTHFSWWKGQSFFLEAAQKLLKSGVAAHFFMAGKDTNGPEAEALIHRLGISSQVARAGFRTDIPDILPLLSVSVVSSVAGEGFSGVLRESMAMGVPVVATDVGGNRELVAHEKTGLLVRPGDSEALAAGIRRLITDRGLAESCAREAQATVRRAYSVESMCEKTLELYERLV
jgi:glycosyltransferase involved in cell wall biosynthesis